MAYGLSGALAEGLRSGFDMGLRLDEVSERKKQRAVDNERAGIADRRADEQVKLAKSRDDRAERRLDAEDLRRATDSAYTRTSGRQKEIVDAARAAQTAGTPVDPELAKEYGSNAAMLAKLRQDGMNFVSRMTAGQIDPLSEDVTPEQLYTNMSLSLGMPVSQLRKMPQHIEDIQTGLSTGNQGLVVQGANGVFQPLLQRGVGGESPHGGTITRKEIIRMDPARDGNGRDHPDKFIPRLRVYVKTPGGEEKYYDAPMTKGGSANDDDQIVAISIPKAMDYMGNMGVAANGIQQPQIAEKLAEGERKAGPQVDRWLRELETLSRPTKKQVSRERVDLGDRVVERTVDETGRVTGETELKKGAAPKVFRPSSGGSGGGARGALRAKLDEIDQMLEDGEIQQDEAVDMKKRVVAGRPGAGGSTKGPSNAEITSAINEATGAAAARLGLKYDKISGEYRSTEGAPATPEQQRRVAAAREAATVAIRDAAAKGQRTSGTDAVGAAKAANPGKTVKWGDLK
jgi:hypothetical protein